METKEYITKAQHVYKESGDEGKSALAKVFSRDVLEPFDFNALLENEQEVLRAYSRLRAKAKEKRGNWNPDFTNRSQYKYHPWFEYKDGVGFVVHVTYCDYARAITDVGSRLCFPTIEMAIEFGKENSADYNIIFQQ